MIHKLVVKGRKIEKVDPFVFVEGGINSDQIEVLASDEWAECTSVTLQMIKPNQETYSYILAGEPVNVPQRFMQDPGKIEFALIGYDGDTVRITTERMRSCAGARVVETGADVTDVAGDPEVDEPDKWAQLINLCTGLQSSVSGIQSDVDAIEAAYFPKTGGTISGNTVIDTGAAEPNLSVKRTVDGEVHEGIVRIDSDGVLGIRHKVGDSAVNNLYLEQSKTRLSKPLDVASGGVPTNGEVGQVLKKGASGAEWVDSLKVDNNGVLAAKSVKVADNPDSPTSGIVLETKTDGTTSIHGFDNEPVGEVIVADCDPETDDSHAVNAKTMREYVGSTGNTLIGTASGNVAHAEDAFAAKPMEIRIKGRTVNNLWPEFNKSYAGITSSTDDSGLITVSGTATNLDSYVSVQIGGVAAGETYTIKTSTEVPSNVIVSVFPLRPDGVEISGNRITVESSATYATGQLPEGTTQLACRFIVLQGKTVNFSMRVMLVEGTEAPNCFTPTGIHGVEPEKLVVAGKNLLQLEPDLVPLTTNGITFTPRDDGGILVIGTATGTAYYNLDFNRGYKNVISPNMCMETITVSCSGAEDVGLNVGAFKLKFDSYDYYTIAKSNGNVTGRIPVDALSLRSYLQVDVGSSVDNEIVYPQLELGSTVTTFEKPCVVNVTLSEMDPLMDGDTLTISQDGSASVERADGTVDQLGTVALPALPAPTFNAYMSGGYIPGEIEAEYERDVNIAYELLEAKIAALEIADATD